MLNRRRFLIAGTLAVPGALAFGSESAVAEPPAPHPDVTWWLNWIADHRKTVAIAASDDAWGSIRHREHRPHILASTIKIVHLSAYATAVAEGRLDPQQPIKVGDWDARHPYVSDGGAHKAALDSLGIPCDELGVADDPDRTVPLDTMVAAMIDFSDNAATDYLRHRLGDGRLRHAAARGGWHRPDLRSLQGEVILLIMPELLPPGLRHRSGPGSVTDWPSASSGTSTSAREVYDRIATMPVTSDEQWPWTQGTGLGSAAQVASLRSHRRRRPVPAAGRPADHPASPRARPDPAGAGRRVRHRVQGRRHAQDAPNLGLNVRWKDGRTGRTRPDDDRPQ